MTHGPHGHVRMRTFCQCGHIGQRHHDHYPHPCANPECDCEGFHIPTVTRDRADHWLPYMRPPKRGWQDPAR